MLETYENKIKYSLSETEVYNTLYVAECNEFGELFSVNFYAPKSYKKEQLMEIGNNLALDWGAVCTNVKKELTEQEKFNKNCSKFGLKPSDYNRLVKMTGEDFNLIGFIGKTKLLLRRCTDKRVFELKIDKKYVPTTFCQMLLSYSNKK